MPSVTRLRAVGRGRAAVELDGVPWRTFPTAVVQRAGLAEGMELDRARLRMLRHELRRAGALDASVAALHQRDHTTSSLDERLARRGVPPVQRQEALAVLGRAGLVDDARFARGRAAALAARGAGDLLVADDLARRGLAPELIASALAALEPERERAARLVAERGLSPQTARFLASKGFDQETLEPLLDGLVADAGRDAIP